MSWKRKKFKSERQAPKSLLTKREFNLDNRPMRIILNHIEINHAIQNKMRIHQNNKFTMGIYEKNAVILDMRVDSYMKKWYGF